MRNYLAIALSCVALGGCMSREERLAEISAADDPQPLRQHRAHMSPRRLEVTAALIIAALSHFYFGYGLTVAVLLGLAAFVLVVPLLALGPYQDIYLVMSDFGGKFGTAWRPDRETVINDLLAGEFNNPIRILAFNTAEDWSRDVTMDIADEVRRRYVEMDDVSVSVLQFTEANRR
jgi:hypothetical protein